MQSNTAFQESWVRNMEDGRKEGEGFRTGERPLPIEGEREKKILDPLLEQVVQLDSRLRVEWANRSACEFGGLREEEIAGRACHEIWGGSASPCNGCPAVTALATGETAEGEIKTPNGRIYRMKAIPIRDFRGRVSGIRRLALDLTEQKRAIEEQRERLETQLIQAQKMEAVGTLAGGIAHDFNNLNQAILGYTELLISGRKSGDPGYRELQVIRKASRMASDLTSQLLTFSRKVESHLRPLNLNQAVQQTMTFLQRTIPKMIRIENSLEMDLNTVNADPTQVEQVLMNLALNASDAMPEGGKLVVSTKNRYLDEHFCRMNIGFTQGHYVCLTVSDTGQGMDKKTLEHIFEPFYTTKAMGKGTGLGLAIVYGIVKNHGGHITCHSARGEGTTFKVYLPALRQALTECDMEAEFGQFIGGQETVLLVDDEESILEFQKQALGKAGYKTLTAEDGETALDLYRRHAGDISLVVLDSNMPGMGGMRCLEELVQLDPGIKVLVVSGYLEEAKAQEAVGSGAKGFIGKPFGIRAFLDEIRSILDA
jgi:signal transduction histidine kinase